jgi:uncharacterized protein (DUF2147 family)
MVFVGAYHVNAQVIGKWKYVDAQDGEEKSIVEIYEVNDRYNGRIIELLPSSRRTHCDRCYGDLKGKPLTGMVVLYDLKKTSNGGRDGKLIDPSSGKIFSCYIELESQDRLKLRGYLGVPSVGKTMYYNRVK